MGYASKMAFLFDKTSELQVYVQSTLYKFKTQQLAHL